MFIKQVKEFDNTSCEADVIVTDGIYELMCYYHSTENIAQGMIVKEILTLFAEDIMRIDSQVYLVHKDNDYYSYYLQGKVLDKQKPLIGIGEIIIELDKPLPKDIEQGEFVEFKVHKLNCF